MSFKGSMANYYHEARAHARKLKEIQGENKRRADRRAEVMGPTVADPRASLFITGQSCKVHRNSELHAANENGDGLIPWNGQQDNMIDRFDGRALLDFYRDPPAHRMNPPKGHDELKLEEMLRFEAYRDLVRLLASGLTDARGLAEVEREVLERRAQQHAAQQAAEQLAMGQRPGAAPAASAPLPMAAFGAGTGAYSAVGFSYGTTGEGGADEEDPFSSDDEDSSEEEGEEEDAGEPVTEAEAAQEAEDERLDELAESYGVQEFSYRLHKVQEKEGEQEALMRKPPRRAMGRKKAAFRARRMAGQGLDPLTGLPLAQARDPYKDTLRLVNPWVEEPQERRTAGGGVDFWDLPERRASPVYDGGKRTSRSRSRSPAGGVTHFITEFKGGARAADNRAPASSGGPAGFSKGGIIEALPDRPDPAMLGGFQPVARELLMVQGIRRAARSPSPAAAHGRRRSRSSSRERVRRSATPPWRKGRGRSRSPGGQRGSTPPWRKGRSRSRSPRRRHDSAAAAAAGHGSSHRSSRRSRSRDRHGRSRSRDRGRGRDKDSNNRGSTGQRPREGQSRSRSRQREQDSSSHGKGAGGRAAAGGQAAGVSGSAAASAPAKETAQERLRRLMKAQLDNAFQKDSLAATQKKMQEEKDKVARMQIHRATSGYTDRYGSSDRERR